MSWIVQLAFGLSLLVVMILLLGLIGAITNLTGKIVQQNEQLAVIEEALAMMLRVRRVKQAEDAW